MRKPRGPIAEIAAAIQGRGKLGHSAIYWWMWDHYDEIRNGRHGRSDWVTVTETLTKIGLTNKDGSALKVENVRKTYSRVVKDKSASVSAKTPAAHPVRIISVPEPTKPAPPPAPAPPDDDAEPAALTEMRERMRAATSIKRKKE